MHRCPGGLSSLVAVAALLGAARFTESAESAGHPIVPGFERLHATGRMDAATAGRLLLGELNCTSCHKPEAAPGGNLLPKQAPILDQVGARMTVEALRAFLADPHQVKPGTTMPDLFAGLSDAQRGQRVEGLVHLLASTGTLAHSMPDKAAAARGDQLFHQVGCVACHGPLRAAPPVQTAGPKGLEDEAGRQSSVADASGSAPAARPVPLGNVAAKYSINSLAEFLKNPHAVRPSGRMPDLNLNDQEARDIAHYLLRDIQVEPNLKFKYFEGNWSDVPDFASLQPKSTGTAAGFDLGVAPRKSEFGLRFEGFLHIAREGEYTFHLGSDDGSRLTIGGQQVVLNGGVHPFGFQSGRAKLTAGAHPLAVDFFQGPGEWELRVEYEGPGLPRQPLDGWVTLTETPPKAKAAFSVDPQLAAQGRELFQTIGCAACHQLRLEGEPLAARKSPRPLAELRAGQGCLAETVAADLPQFQLSAAQREALCQALAAGRRMPEDPEQAIEFTLAALNCYACHLRNKAGGVEPAYNAFFQSTIPEMGDEGRIPPPLDGVGDKLTAEWLKHLFDSGAKDRPYMLCRMPKFGLNNIGGLAQALAAADLKETTRRPEFSEPLYRVKSEARYMVGDKALSCIKCHNFAQYQATGITAASLTEMPRRLREDWYYRYMVNPQAYRPGTRMPSAWPNGQSILPNVFGGDTHKQLAAIWIYLSDGHAAAIPLGLIRDPIELKPQKEPIIYRNFIEGLSPRGIAVGYPEGVNLAFDAESFSLALIWHGAFIDASKHWTGRGSGFQSPLGDHVVPLPGGVPFATLNGAHTPWPNTPPAEAGYRFLGYRLDKNRRPTFRYEFASVRIEDFPLPVPGERDAGFQRTLTLTAENPPDNVLFRAAVGSKIEALSDGWYRIDNAVQMRFNASGHVREDGGRSELLVPVKFDGKAAHLVQEIHW